MLMLLLHIKQVSTERSFVVNEERSTDLRKNCEKHYQRHFLILENFGIVSSWRAAFTTPMNAACAHKHPKLARIKLKISIKAWIESLQWAQDEYSNQKASQKNFPQFTCNAFCKQH